MESLTLTKDFREFFELLNSEKVEYLLIGGFAVALHGHVRNTGDIDAWVKPEAENAKRLGRALRQFGLSADTIEKAALSSEKRVFQMGVPPYRIDVLTSISGVDFDGAYQRRQRTMLNGVEVNLISLQDLRTNKAASGRTQDLADLEKLPTE